LAAYADAGVPVYVYFFTEPYAANSWPGWMGVMHGDEILFMFGHVLRDSSVRTGRWPITYTPAEKELSRRMMSYWTNFAKTRYTSIFLYVCDTVALLQCILAATRAKMRDFGSRGVTAAALFTLTLFRRGRIIHGTRRHISKTPASERHFETSPPSCNTIATRKSWRAAYV